MEIEQLCIYLTKVHPESDKLHFDISVSIKSHLTGKKIYALKQIIDKNDFDDLFHTLLINAEEQIRNTILLENQKKANEYERKRKV